MEKKLSLRQFLIDSEASLKSVLPRLAPAVQTYETTGKVEAVSAHDIKFRINLSPHWDGAR